MAAGDFEAGAGIGGYDPVVTSRPITDTEQPTALSVDGLTRDNQLDANGRYVKVHWVDAAAFDLLRMAKGSVSSAPEHGETISEIRYIDRERVVAQVNDRVKLAWAMLLTRSLVRIVAVTVDLSVAGRIMTVVDYENLVTGKRRKASTDL